MLKNDTKINKAETMNVALKINFSNPRLVKEDVPPPQLIRTPQIDQYNLSWNISCSI